MTASGPIGAAPGLSTEAALITAVLAGERDKFHLLILPYEAQLYRTAFALVKNTQEAEDVVQDAVLKAYRRLASFRGDAKFSTWLIAITLNEARSRLRRENRVPTDSLDERREDQGDFTPAALTDWREVPQAALERQEIRSLIECALAELPESYREIILLRDVEELSVNETAELLGISIALVKVRLHRARMMLQKILAPQLSRTANNVLQSGKRSWLGRFSWL